MTEIIIASIAALGGLIGTVVGIRMNTSLVTYRLAQLEKRVELHNNLISRTYELEKESEIFKEKIKVVNHRLDDIEEDI